MMRIRTLHLDYFSHKIDFEPVQTENSIVSDTFFYAESESGSIFWLSRLVFTGLPDSIESGNPEI